MYKGIYVDNIEVHYFIKSVRSMYACLASTKHVLRVLNVTTMTDARQKALQHTEHDDGAPDYS